MRFSLGEKEKIYESSSTFEFSLSATNRDAFYNFDRDVAQNMQNTIDFYKSFQKYAP